MDEQNRTRRSYQTGGRTEHTHHVQTTRAQDAQTQRRREAARKAAQAKRAREAQAQAAGAAGVGAAGAGAAGAAEAQGQVQAQARTQAQARGRAAQAQDRAAQSQAAQTPTIQLTPEEELRSSRISMLEEERSKYSREAVGSKYAKTRKRGKRRKRSAIIAVIALVVVLAGGGTAYAYLHSVSGNMHQGVDDSLLGALVDPAQPEDPFYMLLMGVDRSQAREKSEQYAGDTFRSDSMILCRVDPKDLKVTMVSLHRDTLLDMGEYGYQKLNAAHAIGGPAYAVKIVSEFAGVPISHYAEIDFDGFREAVDALGGVEVNVPIEIDDSNAGGHLDAGPQTLNGKQALILCRSRHSYDDYGDGDRFRAANQRMVISAVAKKLLDSNVGTMTRTIKAMSKYITTDFDVTDIVNLAISMRGLDTSANVYTAMEPTTADYVDGGWYEYVIDDAWKTMMDRVDAGLPPTEEDEVDQLGTVMASTGNANAAADADKTSGEGTGTAEESAD